MNFLNIKKICEMYCKIISYFLPLKYSVLSFIKSFPKWPEWKTIYLSLDFAMSARPDSKSIQNNKIYNKLHSVLNFNFFYTIISFCAGL